VSRLRVLASSRRELEACAYCPKLCRFTCPVSEVTQREALTPWGKMSAAFLVEMGARPPDAALATAAFACTGCGRCRAFCRNDIDVPDALGAARGAVVAAGFAPAGVAELLRRFRRDGSPVGRLDEVREASGADVASPSEGEAFFPGCVALAREPYDVRAAQAVGRELSARLPLARASDRCCGYPLYAAGDREAFAAHARRVASRFSATARLVVGDPGCAHTLKNLYPAFGVELRCEIALLATHLEAAVQRIHHRKPLRESVTYHDPCHLARSLGCTEPPRRLLGLAVEELIEPAHSGLETVCAGAGAALPWALPLEADAMGRARAAELEQGAASIVTACPTAKRALRRAGARVRDLAAVTAAWLGLSAVEE